MARGISGVDWLRALEGGSAGHRTVEWLDVLVYAEEEHGSGASRWLADEMGVSLRSAERYLAITKPGVGQSQQPSRHAQVEAAQRLQARIQREWDRADAADQRRQVADLLRAIRRVAPGTVRVRSVSRGKNRSGSPRATLESSRSIPGEIAVDLSDAADLWEQGLDGEAAAALSDAIIDGYGNRGDIDELSRSIRIVEYPPDMDYR